MYFTLAAHLHSDWPHPSARSRHVAGGLRRTDQRQSRKPSSLGRFIARVSCFHTCSAEGIFHKAAGPDRVTSPFKMFRGFLPVQEQTEGSFPCLTNTDKVCCDYLSSSSPTPGSSPPRHSPSLLATPQPRSSPLTVPSAQDSPCPIVCCWRTYSLHPTMKSLETQPGTCLWGHRTQRRRSTA